MDKSTNAAKDKDQGSTGGQAPSMISSPWKAGAHTLASLSSAYHHSAATTAAAEEVIPDQPQQQQQPHEEVKIIIQNNNRRMRRQSFPSLENQLWMKQIMSRAII